MISQNYLVLETPRTADLGHRIITSSGVTEGPSTDKLLKHAREQGSDDAIMIASHMVMQRGQSGLTSREGVERLILVSPSLHSLDQTTQGQLRDHLSNYLRGHVEKLLNDPELIRNARERTVLGHSRLDEWLRSIEFMFFSQVSTTNTPPAMAEVGSGQEPSQTNPPVGKAVPVDYQISTARKRNSTPSGYLVIACLIGAVVVGIGVVRHRSGRAGTDETTTARSYKGKYDWLPNGIDKPRTEEQANEFEGRLNECWQALDYLVSMNGSHIEDWKILSGLEDYPIRAWLVGVSSAAQRTSHDLTEEERFNRILAVLRDYREKVNIIPGSSIADTPWDHMDNTEYLKNILDDRHANRMEGSYAELKYSPSAFFEKMYRLMKWEELVVSQ